VIKWAPVDDEGNFLIDEFEKLLSAAHQDGRDHSHVEYARTLVAGQGGGALAHAPASPCCSTAPQASVHLGTSTSKTRLRFLLRSPATSSTDRPAIGGALRQARRISRPLPPFNGGGEMIREVFEDRITYGEPPAQSSRPAPRRSCRRSGLGAAIDIRQFDRKARIRCTSPRSPAMPRERLARDQPSLRHLRHHQGQGPDRLVRDQGRPSARRRDHHRTRSGIAVRAAPIA